MDNKDLPQKILHIKECTFILPDDFNGTTEDAFRELLKYQSRYDKNAQYVDKEGLYSTFDLLNKYNIARFCGHYSLYTLSNGEYSITE